MLEIEKIMVEGEVLKSKTCDVCGKKYIPDDLDFQEFFHIGFSCGYGSIFEDGKVVRIDICQHCFKERLGNFIRVEDE